MRDVHCKLPVEVLLEVDLRYLFSAGKFLKAFDVTIINTLTIRLI